MPTRTHVEAPTAWAKSLWRLAYAGTPSQAILPTLRWAPARRFCPAYSAIALATLLLAGAARADALLDEAARAALLKRADGRIVHVESEYNDIYVTKRRSELTMSFQLKGWDYTESVSNLSDPDDLPLRYTQVMTVAAIYPETPKRILMLGLGAGTLSTYLGRFMPEANINVVEIDRRVIDTAKTYFGLRETERVRYLDSDGRVFLNRRKETYDLILLDAYRGGFVPFHLLTREFYELVKQHLAPGGAVASNVHDGTKLYHSTVKTLAEVFPSVELYPSGQGEVIAIGTAWTPDQDILARRAAALQQAHNFRFPLPQLFERRKTNTQSEAEGGELITDDFAPVNLYDMLGNDLPRRK